MDEFKFSIKLIVGNVVKALLIPLIPVGIILEIAVIFIGGALSKRDDIERIDLGNVFDWAKFWKPEFWGMDSYTETTRQVVKLGRTFTSPKAEKLNSYHAAQRAVKDIRHNIDIVFQKAKQLESLSKPEVTKMQTMVNDLDTMAAEASEQTPEANETTPLIQHPLAPGVRKNTRK